MNRLNSLLKPIFSLVPAILRWRIFQGLYWRISFILLLLLVCLGIAQGVRWRYGADRATQLLNWGLAQKLAEQFRPILEDQIDETALIAMLHEMSLIYEGTQLYILDSSGKVLAFLGEPADLQLTTIDLKPVKQFIELYEPKNLPILGNDPLSAGRKIVFSASIVPLAEKSGYLYAVLSSKFQTNMEDEIVRGFTSGSAVPEVLMMFAITGIVGLLLFFILTRRFHQMTAVVSSFQSGDLSKRIAATGSDEVGQLARTFNQMADTIQANILALNEKDHQRRQLIANIAHDLRAPLVSIIGFLETIIIKGETEIAQPWMRYLESSHENSLRLEQMISDLFELSKLEAKEAVPKLATFSMLELGNSVLETLLPLAIKSGVHLDLISDDQNPYLVYADQVMIERVLVNLLGNAIRHTPARGEVQIILTNLAEKIQVTVKDTGEGIPEDQLPYIFERFYQVNSQQVKTKGGSGLGLAIVKRIIDAHQAQIHCVSELGKGTSFTFCLIRQISLAT